MGQLDQEAVGDVVKRMDDERAAAMKRLAGRLAEHGVLRKGLSTKDAEHILFMLTGFEAFDTLLTERGLSRDKAVDLLINTAEQALYSE
jgi:hypothetical protein